jgi:CTP synthase (UTP-ammonia lyase)
VGPFYRALKRCYYCLMVRIAIVGEFSPTFRPHVATNEAIAHSVVAEDLRVTAEWVSAGTVDAALLQRYSAIWVAPGSPYKSLEGALRAIRHAREGDVPCFGTCGGFQHMVIEYARNVLGFADAQHAEYDPYASNLFVSDLVCSLAGRELPLTFAPGSRVAQIYQANDAVEQYYCNFGVHPEKVSLLKSGALKISGWDPEGEIRVVELPDHPFFIGTLYVPQARSTADQPHPLVTSFLRAATGRPT